jgi:hypothetical protein
MSACGAELLLLVSVRLMKVAISEPECRTSVLKGVQEIAGRD